MLTKFNGDDLLHVSTAKCQDGGCLAQRIVPFNSDFLPGRTDTVSFSFSCTL